MSEIRVLKELDHIRKRPGMYIGDTKNPTHLIKEVLDNSLDELLNEFATVITLEYNDNGYAAISDNGRGFPIHDVTLSDGSITDSVVAAVEHLFSGAKFDDNTYDISKGTHGVGLSAVNALSKSMTMTIKDRVNKKLVHYYEFENGILKTKQQGELEAELPFSTKTTFQVDPQYFNKLQFDAALLEKELFLISAKYQNSQIYVNNKLIPHGSMDDYFRWICGVASTTPVFNVSYTSALKEEISAYFTYQSGTNIEPMGDVNLGLCTGTYLSSFATLFYNVIKENYADIPLSRSEVLNNFRFYISLKIKEPKYDSQNKMRMVKNINHLFNSQIKKQLLYKISDKYIKSHFNSILESKQMRAASKFLKPVGTRVSTDNPLKDCEQTPGKILYILEGDSAEGTLKQVRNSKTEAILPVNGKIINSVKIGIDKAVTTKLKYMLEALGVDPLKKKNTYRYEKVKVICDADPDGLHISVLVSIAIWRFASDLIREGRFSIIIPPLYGASKKTEFVPIYNQKDLASYSSGGYTINRFKGLGEMNAMQLDAILKNPIEYIATLPQNEMEETVVYELMTDSTLKKKVCQDTRFSLENLTKRMSKSEI